MHEVHQVQRIVAEATQLAKDKQALKVKSVTILVGEMLGFDEGCIRLYWEEMTPGTPLEGSELVLQFVPAKLLCPKCEKIFEEEEFDLECPQCRCLGKPTPSGKEFCIKDFQI